MSKFISHFNDPKYYYLDKTKTDNSWNVLNKGKANHWINGFTLVRCAVFFSPEKYAK